MPERVVVIVDAKDQASGVLRGITAQFGALGNVVQELTGKSINWGNVTALASQAIINGVKESVKATVEYANQVRSLAEISGTGAEESSRLLQVMDDMKISADQVKLATRAMTKEGLSPTIDAIADLSDEYLKLNPGTERAAFLIKNFGRAGLELAETMSKGGTALREMGDAVQDGLILNEEALKQARDYELALDNWDDAVQSLKISVGSELIPFLTNLINLDVDTAMLNAANATGVAGAAARALAPPVDSATASYIALGQALQTAGDSASETASNDYKKLLDMTMKLNDARAIEINQLAYQDLYKQLAEDAEGLTSAERDALNEIGISLGIFDQKAVDTAARVDELNQKFLDGTISILNYSSAIKNIPTYVNTVISTTTTENANPSGGDLIEQR